ncbi:carbonic anhydrase 2 [Leptinotarsa decemlineata]|uniref:carbonic anhydrase 2 n=1 Tax=Leptinotarsa decemlineata TaxID=7539 RepID=UPI000C253EFF|nr:carbonic anhydrase 2-like [Leptinotarsa decemlineata]
MLLGSAIFVMCFFADLGFCQDFGYDGTIGPNFWGERYQNCGHGKLQSPIDIEETDVIVQKFPPLIFKNFDEPLESVHLKNNGHTVVVSISGGAVPSISGGPLAGTYNFSQLHFHWGKTDEEGSENLINNQSFPLELHMVMFKTDHGSFAEAANETDGLAVLSFLYIATSEDNENYEQFAEQLLLVQDVGSSVDINGFVSLDDFTTTDRNHYFTYRGSLTTPPCSEVVIWIEFKNTIKLSHNQLQEFRELSGQEGKLEHNFRPIQPLHDRVVYMNSPE